LKIIVVGGLLERLPRNLASLSVCFGAKRTGLHQCDSLLFCKE